MYPDRGLTVDEGDLGSGSVDLDDSSLNHFVVKIVSFASSFSNTGEHRVTYAAVITGGQCMLSIRTTVSLGDVVDQFHDEHSLADSSTAEETDFTSLRVRSDQVHNLSGQFKIIPLNSSG